MSVIQVTGLRKEYKRLRGASTVAVDDLSFEVPEGGVFGFLGPNGSGKTTTIRCLLGLITPTRGALRMFGADVRTSIADVIGSVGSLVESPAPFPGFSARRNLDLLAKTAGVPSARVDEALERVGLRERADDLLKNYSLGMKQRWGIAAALLKDPRLLILDEPANGLDPAGIREIRLLLRALADEGRTVFVSSHILNEVQQVCDRVAILSHGRCVAEGTVHDVLAGGGAKRMLVRVPDPAAAEQVLAKAGLEVVARGDLLAVGVPPEEAGAITKALASKRIYLTEMRPDEVSLEEVFLSLTEDAE